VKNQPNEPKHATLLDVANRAGVSRATASLVLRETGRVSQPTRERVFQAMHELGYVYNRGAASLRSRDSRVIGVLVTTVTNPFFAEVIVGLEERLAELGYVSLLANTLNDVDRQANLVTFLHENHVAGVVLVPAFATDPRSLDSFAEREIPLLFLTRAVGANPKLYIGTNDIEGGGLAAKHLIWHGCRDIAYLGGREDAIARRDRILGLQAAADQHGLGSAHLTYITSPTTARGGLAAARELLNARTPVDGILCHSDDVALGVYRALHDAAKANIARVISFDNIDNAELFEPPLSTVSGKPIELGRQAAQAIYQHVSGGTTPITTRIRPELITRQSCGCRGYPMNGGPDAAPTSDVGQQDSQGDRTAGRSRRIDAAFSTPER
jgi:LacI family transcriptional regulator